MEKKVLFMELMLVTPAETPEICECIKVVWSELDQIYLIRCFNVGSDKLAHTQMIIGLEMVSI